MMCLAGLFGNFYMEEEREQGGIHTESGGWGEQEKEDGEKGRVEDGIYM